MFVGKFKLHCFLRFQDSNFYFTYTVRYRYNTVNLLTNILKRHIIAHPLGLAMGCLLQIQHLIDILPQFLKLFMYYLTILDRVITVLGCNMQCVNFRKENVFWVTSMDKDIHFSRLSESTPAPVAFKGIHCHCFISVCAQQFRSTGSRVVSKINEYRDRLQVKVAGCPSNFKL